MAGQADAVFCVRGLGARGKLAGLWLPELSQGIGMDITELLAFSVKNKASDLHLSAGCRR